MTWLIVIFWIAVACVWIAIAAVIVALLIGVYLVCRWIWRRYIAWRNERQLVDEQRMQAGFRSIRRRAGGFYGWEDLQ